MDVSDGLLLDLERMAHASRVQIALRAEDLPLSSIWGDMPTETRLLAAATGGEDYELVFTARPSFPVSAMLDGVSATCIGTVATTENYGVQLIGPSGEIMDTVRKGWDPFSG